MGMNSVKAIAMFVVREANRVWTIPKTVIENVDVFID
jgi:hypothetical protein